MQKLEDYACNEWYTDNDGTQQRMLVRCPSCNLENYAMNVMTGICTWCGYDINNHFKI